jgi:hypothetical protein
MKKVMHNALSAYRDCFGYGRSKKRRKEMATPRNAFSPRRATSSFFYLEKLFYPRAHLPMQPSSLLSFAALVIHLSTGAVTFAWCESPKVASKVHAENIRRNFDLTYIRQIPLASSKSHAEIILSLRLYLFERRVNSICRE